MPDINNTVGDASANSFVSEDEFADYCDARLNSSAYTNATSGDRIRALIEATRELSLLEYNGLRVDTTQALSWPRLYCPNPDAPLPAPGELRIDYAGTIIPQRVKDATCEYALQFLKAGTDDIASGETVSDVKREKVGPIEIEYADTSSREGIATYPRVMNYVRSLLSSKSFGIQLSRV